MNTLPMYIGGNLVATESVYDVVNPATLEVTGSITKANASDANHALEAAEKAFATWSTTTISERVQWMNKLRDAVIENEMALREAIQLEMGKSWAGTQEDFESLVNSLAFYAEEISRFRPDSLLDKEGTHSHELVHEPVGVVAAFLAWNFPLLNLAFKIGPAMASGCPIVIKPSLKSPMSAYLVGKLCHDIGLPAGVVNVVCGDDAEVGDALSASTIPSMLTLIGSIATGRHIMKTGSTSIKRYSMELGGNAPVLVFADSDLDLAADIVCAVKFGNCGQICVTPNRVFVQKSVASEFASKVVERAKAVKVGYGLQSDNEMGPLIDAQALKRVDELVQDAVIKGAALLYGGNKPDLIHTGHFYMPTVLTHLNSEMRMYQEEIFGPVVSIYEFENEAEVLDHANDTDAGLTAYVFTQDQAKAQRCATQLRFGEIQINGVKYGIDLPHGGIKQSGIGCDCSHLALHDYLAVKRITRALD
ncbi:NAD-dependent succinate-semialdehyde dehydrogenase [Vibrio sp. vnigr-6D03]|uniref:NAD-dependent succinate-semialdehyde dehydrogenase n=1 Tax=Vibrio sp. vnigr-6D03 TaxID=2058088 RepID=UPI000C339942|nr:NAD-dependent succinate-semialdehyde dehydrogenase [Vibrio sp. vnigr-6D03]PKF77614.1 NAD-dependent succinate-semialdehyde dehydrogenase [Vibrio sp. vnigr-6D03]